MNAVRDIVAQHFARDIDASTEHSKQCACGAMYVREAFHSLPFVGVMDDGVEKLVLRNCPCGSTLAIAVPR